MGSVLGFEIDQRYSDDSLSLTGNSLGANASVGARQAERLGAGGLVISAGEATRIGLIDELAPLEHVVDRAVEWCQGLLRLPQQAMTITRRRARADLASYFDQNLEQELDDVIARWWGDEGQTILKALAARLARKRPG